MVRVKGSVTTQQRWTRQARDAADPDTARLLARLREVTKQLAGLAVAGRLSDGHRSDRKPTWAALLRSLSDERARTGAAIERAE